MSFKLQDRIQRIKGLPGKYKRLLLAMASHADKEGANIWASKATLAAEIGVVRFTVNRNMDALLVAGLVRESESHTCENDFCPKGPKHYTQHGNHWTQAYDIDLVALQNVTPLPKKVTAQNVTPLSKVVAHFVTESRHILCESGSTFCAAKQGTENPAPLGSVEHASLGEKNNNNRPVVVVPQTPLEKVNTELIAGYTESQIAAHAEACKDNPWVAANDGVHARKRLGYVEHLMTIDPPRKTNGHVPAFGGHAAKNPELHTGLDALGNSWTVGKIKVRDMVKT